MGLAQKRLARARKIRHRIASELHALSEGELTLENVLRDPSDALKRVRIYYVLLRTPHIREDGANNILKRAKVWPTERLGNLTPEERAAVIRALPERARKP